MTTKDRKAVRAGQTSGSPARTEAARDDLLEDDAVVNPSAAPDGAAERRLCSSAGAFLTTVTLSDLKRGHDDPSRRGVWGQDPSGSRGRTLAFYFRHPWPAPHPTQSAPSGAPARRTAVRRAGTRTATPRSPARRDPPRNRRYALSSRLNGPHSPSAAAPHWQPRHASPRLPAAPAPHTLRARAPDAGQHHVRRAETRSSARVHPRAAPRRAPDQVRPSSRAARSGYPSSRQPPDPCRRQRPRRIRERRHHREPDPQRLGAHAQELHIASLAMPRTRNPDRMPGAARRAPHAARRARTARGKIGERAVERDLVDPAHHAQRLQRRRPLRRQRQPERRIVGPEELARMRLERHHAQRQIRSRAMRRMHQMRVPEMNPVEIAPGASVPPRSRSGTSRSARDDLDAHARPEPTADGVEIGHRHMPVRRQRAVHRPHQLAGRKSGPLPPHRARPRYRTGTGSRRPAQPERRRDRAVARRLPLGARRRVEERLEQATQIARRRMPEQQKLRLDRARREYTASRSPAAPPAHERRRHIGIDLAPHRAGAIPPSARRSPAASSAARSCDPRPATASGCPPAPLRAPAPAPAPPRTRSRDRPPRSASNAGIRSRANGNSTSWTKRIGGGGAPRYRSPPPGCQATGKTLADRIARVVRHPAGRVP